MLEQEKTLNIENCKMEKIENWLVTKAQVKMSIFNFLQFSFFNSPLPPASLPPGVGRCHPTLNSEGSPLNIR
jgi:hypothetical protein